MSYSNECMQHMKGTINAKSKTKLRYVPMGLKYFLSRYEELRDANINNVVMVQVVIFRFIVRAFCFIR